MIGDAGIVASSTPMPAYPPGGHQNLKIVALVATCDRHASLIACLRSIAAQTRPPDVVIVVDDGPREEHHVVRACLDEAPLPTASKLLLTNRRTRGAAGAWNTGIDEFTRNCSDPGQVFIAVLDDDDRWRPDHLSACLEAAVASDVDMVAAGIVRFDAAHPEGRAQSLPTRLSADDAWLGNPHIQGSNLFVRLTCLLEAGLFDESLASTTDRDLLVRLADLGIVRFAAVARWTVEHDASDARDRLSTPGSPHKRDGLRRFFAKYRLRMSDGAEQAFRTRAAALFACTDLEAPDAIPLPATAFAVVEPGDPIALVAGVIADGDAHGAGRARSLLEDLHALQADRDIAGLTVIVLENGPPVAGRPLQALALQMRESGLDVVFIPVEVQCEDAARGWFGPGIERGPGRAAIGSARTMVQHYVHALATKRPGCVAWILDDDKRLDPLVVDARGVLRRSYQPIVPTLRSLRKHGIAVALGIDTGAAPLPAMCTLRVQLVDLAANLHALAALPPHVAWPDRSSENLEQRRAHCDAHHDLARTHTAHLEDPWWWVPAHVDETVCDAFVRLTAAAPRIAAGEQVLRPLAFDPAYQSAFEASDYRGGSTFVLDLQALRDVPNSVPAVDGRETRRSDMIWAILQRHCHSRAVVRAPLAVFHDRSTEPAAGLDVERCVDDLRGYASVRALDNLLRKRQRGGADDLRFSEDEVSFAIASYRTHLQERTGALRLSLYRARGAARSAARCLADEHAWWNRDRETQAAAERLHEYLRGLISDLAPSRIDAVLAGLTAPSDAHMGAWLRDIRGRVDGAALANTLPVTDLLEREREASARALVERLFHARGLRLLGSGAEGVSLTDGARVYKCIDAWKSRDGAGRCAWLGSLIGHWTDTRGLLPILELRVEHPRAVIVQPFEMSDPYQGGHAEGLARLLRECREHAIACRNLHPSNLRVVGNDVRLIDYGADIVPWTEVEWRHMLRRAWLCWRWAHLPDLKDRMRRALTEEIPELDGWERLASTVQTPTKEALLDPLFLDRIHTDRPRRILDYGAGKGRLAERLADDGFEVVAYDPALPRVAQRPGLIITDARATALAGAPFDAVVCSLVLCVLDDDAYHRVLEDLRSALTVGGRVYIAVCNPFFTCGGSTPLQRRALPPDVDPAETFVWHKQLAANGAWRRDVHRPYERLRRDLLRVGLVVQETLSASTVDLERLEPASDFLFIVACATLASPPVDLVIKACAQEWRTLATQVRHLVDQLEGPGAFRTRLLVLDGRAEGFTRAYDTADLEALRREANALVRRGLVDQVIDAPADGPASAALLSRWFGVSTPASHTAKGAPLTPSLVGFEACASPYVLQVDADLMIMRTDRAHDPISELVGVLESDPHALTASLNICSSSDRVWTSEGPGGPWRVEVRGAMFHRRRLLAGCPWPNEVLEGHCLNAWHRAVDQGLAGRALRSYRGGDARFGFIHPTNIHKRDREGWLARLDRVEHGWVPTVQRGRVDLEGDLDLWIGPPRHEPIVVIACGRDVGPGRFLRWLDALTRQRRSDWGAVVVDDGGSTETQAYLRHVLAPYAGRITLLTINERRGGLANTVWALRHICTSRDSVIALVDADDALLGDTALARVMQAYDEGADLTVGSMLRTDKTARYPAELADPRRHRGGNVWQHLRTFRRALFDEVPDDYLRLDGIYVDLAWDWALMLPLVELARNPVYIEVPMYLYETSRAGKHGPDRVAREAIIARLLAKPSLRSRPP